jgi:hypothetical protein
LRKWLRLRRWMREAVMSFVIAGLDPAIHRPR